MEIEKLRENNELIDLFCNLAEIPSPSLKEENVANWIVKYCQTNNISCKLDDYGNVYANVPATDENKSSLLLSAHMDVIGDESPVKTYIDGDLIRAKDRTLGGDDKAGVANALLLAKEVANSQMRHGGLELMFTRDEESGMSGIKHVDFSKLNSKYILVCDSDSLGQLEVSGASYTIAKITVNTYKGGHSGIDIADKTRENAAKLIADIISNLPQGVFYSENNQVITSCNLGGIRAGDVNVTNVINTHAEATYSIRSASRSVEEELKTLMQNEIAYANKEYANIAKFEITFEEHLPPFEKVEDEYIPILFETAAKKVGIPYKISSFHAGAETHIYAGKKNKNGEIFSPYLVGLATVYNMHSKDEALDYNSIIQGHKLIQAFFEAFNN